MITKLPHLIMQVEWSIMTMLMWHATKQQLVDTQLTDHPSLSSALLHLQQIWGEIIGTYISCCRNFQSLYTIEKPGRCHASVQKMRARIFEKKTSSSSKWGVHATGEWRRIPRLVFYDIETSKHPTTISWLNLLIHSGKLFIITLVLGRSIQLKEHLGQSLQC